MRNITFLIIIFLEMIDLNAQFTNHGIDLNWYQTPKVAANITGNISAMNNVAGSVANSMVVKQNGTVIIFYRQGGQNKWIQSSDGGNTWNSPGTLFPLAVNGLSTITADIDQNDHIYIAWKSDVFSIDFAKYDGTSWIVSNTINTISQTGSDTVQFSQISVDRKGRIHLMWQQGNHQNYSPGIKSTCWHALSSDGGTTFSPTLLSQGNTYHAAFPVADFSGTTHDTLLIAWRENVNGGTNYSNWNWDVKASISYDGGVVWNSVFTLAGNTIPGDDDQWDPNIVIDKNGIIHAFYHVYHDNTIPDYNANIIYKYSLNGGNLWSTPQQLSTNGIRSHLIKTAYDYTNNYVWCAWKDEIDFGNLPNNPQADLKGVYIMNTGTPIISSEEFICDHDTLETAFHNFKIGNDGIIRATYNISKLQGKGDSIFYTQRNSLSPNSSFAENLSNLENIRIYPNPSNDYFYIENAILNEFNFKLYNSSGIVINNYELNSNKIYILNPGFYILEISNENNQQYIKLIKE